MLRRHSTGGGISKKILLVKGTLVVGHLSCAWRQTRDRSIAVSQSPGSAFLSCGQRQSRILS